MRVVIVRDRESAGGGIYNYYRAIGLHLSVAHDLVDVGRSHSFYDAPGTKRLRSLPTPLRLGMDWLRLLRRLCGFPTLVLLNPSLDPVEFRSMPRDAVNVLLAKCFGRKVLVFWRGWDNVACGTPEFPGGNSGWLSRVYRMADAHIVLASDFRDDLRRWGVTAPIHLETTVCADAVLDFQGPTNVLGGDVRFRVLFLSRVEIAKGVFEMLEAFALLEAREPGRYRFIIAGDGPALPEMKRRAKELCLQEIEFMGYVDGVVKSECFSEADAFCFPSYTEGMPNAVLEAMATGLPLISSTAGGLKDILEDGVSGYFLSYDRNAEPGHRFSADDIACKIGRLASEPETRRKMADHNRCYARRRFAAKTVAARLGAICRGVLGEVDNGISVAASP